MTKSMRIAALLGSLIPFMSGAALAQQGMYDNMYVSCDYRFAVIFPAQPTVTNINYTTHSGASVFARQFSLQQGNNQYRVTVVPLMNGPTVDNQAVEHAAEQIRKRGSQIRFQYSADYDPGMPGRQLNLSEPNGRQLRASVYMADHRLTITEASAGEGDFAALQFEQSITLIDANGNDLDRPNNGEVRNFGCRR